MENKVKKDLGALTNGYRFSFRKTFYPFPVHEFNLPSGWSCPFAVDCRTRVDRITGKTKEKGRLFRCYASVSERYPAVREQRWTNFELAKAGTPIILPKGTTHVRIHGSGDFFSQEYFDQWLDVCRQNPSVKFWAFTKSIRFWVARIECIPQNLTMQASYGSVDDHLIEKYGLKNAKVYPSEEDVPVGVPIDTDDSLAMSGAGSFALVDNFKRGKNKLITDSSCTLSLFNN